MSKPKFFGGFKQNKNREFSIGISLDNTKFLGHNLAVFVYLANKHVNQIDNILIFIGNAPYACYVGSETAKQVADAWREQAEPYLKKLKKPYKVVYWEELAETDACRKLAIQIEQDYRNNTDGFKEIVDRVALEFIANKQTEQYTYEKAIQYLLTEAPVYAMLKGKSAYPLETLNDVLMHVVKKYNPYDFEYCGYNIGNGKIPGEISSQDDSKNKEKEILILTEQLKNMTEQVKVMNEKMEEQRLQMQAYMEVQAEQMNAQMAKMDRLLKIMYQTPNISLQHLDENQKTDRITGYTLF